MKKNNYQSGFSLIEILLAVTIFFIIGSGAVVVTLQGFDSNRLGKEITQGNQFAAEGIEALRSIKNQSFSNLTTNATLGVTQSGGVWTISGTNNVFDKYTRVLSIADVQRDGSGNIVSSGGTNDPLTKKVTSTVSWNFNSVRPESVVLSSYLTNWRLPSRFLGGMLVFGDNSPADAIKYRILNNATQQWGTIQTAADVDGTSTNRVLRAVKIYASSTRNEKVMISRHYNGTTQYIYGQVYNGTSWGNVQLLSSWNAATFLDVQNFDGTYQSNGTFVVVFSDNTVIPKMRTWNGSVWSAQTSLTTLGGAHIPGFITLKARPGTNEMMAAFFTEASGSISEYYSGSAWSAITSHSTTAPLATKKLVDFDWSPTNPLIGELVYTTGATDRAIHLKIWTANGTGGGAWGAVVNGANQGTTTTRLGAVDINGRLGANEFQICDANTAQQIICYKSDFTPTITNPTNPIIASNTDIGIQRTFDLAYETQSGAIAPAAYSDNTAIAKLKKYTASTSTWDAAATSLFEMNGTLRTVRVIPASDADDMMMLFGDGSQDLYSVGYDGTNNAPYTPRIGTSLLESTNDSNAAQTAEAFQMTAAATGTVNTITVYMGAANTATTWVLGLYANNAGHPGTLLSQASTTTFVPGTWNTITIPATSLTSGTVYWLGVLGLGGTNSFRDRAGGPCIAEGSASTTLTSLPTTWSTGATYTSCPISAFASYDGNTPVGHAVNGSAVTDYWFDFAWDKF